MCEESDADGGALALLRKSMMVGRGRSCLFAAIAAFLLATDAWAESTDPPPRVAGVGLNVSDIARSERFYADVLGLKVAMRVPAQGETRESVLTTTGTLDGALVVLAKLDSKPLSEGRGGFGRVILNCGDAEAVAKRAEAAGFKTTRYDTKAANGPVVYFIEDPDGYRVEIYQPGPNDVPAAPK